MYEQPDNLVDLFNSAVEKFGERPLFGVKTAPNSYQWLTYQQIGQRVDHLRGGLAQLGVGRGDAVGIIARNRPEWAVIAFAAFGLGARCVPMYETELPRIWEYIIRDSSVKVLFVASPQIAGHVQEFRGKLASLEQVVVIDSENGGSMAAVEQAGARLPIPPTPPTPRDIAVLIYTSGTTDQPKGVLLSHGNLTSNARAGWRLFPQLNEESRSLAMLPWAHSYGLTAELVNSLQFGGAMAFPESAATFLDDIAAIRPTLLLSVPRVFTKIYNGLLAQINARGGLARIVFSMGMTAAKRRRELAAQGKSCPLTNLQFRIADYLVFSKVRALFGGQLQAALTASATMNIDIAHFFIDAGVPLYDVYGLTECSPAVTMNCPAAWRLGSVGRPIERVTVVIDKTGAGADATDGEIVVYGPNVMQGYHNKPEATRAVLTADGGLRTGDRGRIDGDGFLFITGRIKEQYKLATGKYVYPATLEEDIKVLPAVANAMIHGEGRDFNIGLIVPNFAALEPVIRARGWPVDPAQLVRQPDFQEYLSDEIASALQDKFRQYEIPRKFIFLAEDFTVENGMLTQTMKLKRRAVNDAYRRQIEEKYQ